MEASDVEKLEEELERLFLRLANISSDNVDQFQNFLKKNLIRILSILLESGGHGEIQRKGLDLMTHLNRRLKSKESLQIPVQDLLVNLCARRINPQLAIIYLKMGWTRLSPSECNKLLPVFARTISVHSTNGSLVNQLLCLYVPKLVALHASKRSTWPDVPIDSDPKHRTLVLDFILDILLTDPVMPASDSSEDDSYAPAGMSVYGYNRVKSLAASDPKDLDALKKDCLRFLVVSEIDIELCTPHIIIGLIDGSNGPAFEAELLWKKYGGSDALESRSCATKVAEIYLGQAKNEKIAEDQRRKPTDLRQRLLLLPLLTRSRMAAQLFPYNIQIVFESLFGKCDTGYRPRNPLAALLGGGNVGARGKDRLQCMAVDFAAAIVLNVPESAVKTICPMIYTAMKNLLEKTEDSSIASRAFGALTKTGLKCPHLVQNDLKFIYAMFEDITKENEETGVAMQECLSGWLPLLKDLDPAQKNVMGNLVDSYINHPNKRAQTVALKYIQVVFHPTHVPSRWHLVTACSNPREDVRRDAERMLHGPLASDQVPDFVQLTRHFAQKVRQTSKSGPIPAKTLHQAVLLCRASLLSVAGAPVSLEISAEDREMVGYKLAKAIRSIPNDDAEEEQAMDSSSAEESNSSTSVVVDYAFLCTELARAKSGLSLPISALSAHGLWTEDVESLLILLELLIMDQKPVSAFIKQSERTMAWIKSCMDESSKNTEQMNVLGELFSWLHADDVDKLKLIVNEILSKNVTTPEALEDNAIDNVIVGEVCGRLKESWTAVQKSRRDSEEFLLQRKLERFVTDRINPDRPILSTQSAVYGAVSMLKAGPLAPAIEGNDEETPSLLVKRLAALALSTKEVVKTKLRELAAKALGFVSVQSSGDNAGGDLETKLRLQVLDSLIQIGSGPPQPELEFVVGESILGICLGASNPDRRKWWMEDADEAIVCSFHKFTSLPSLKKRVKLDTVENEAEKGVTKMETDNNDGDANGSSPSGSSSKALPDANGDDGDGTSALKRSDLGGVVDCLMNEKVVSDNPHLRQASLIWLFMICQKAARWHPALQRRLTQLQETFIEGLTEGNEFSQDVSSKGIGLVYELCTEEQRKQMVPTLLSSFTEGRKSKKAVSADTKLFSKGAFGKTPFGDSPTTYGELCSLATDLGQPDLVYKFMNLAQHNAMWNSRKGAALGFEILMERARTDLEPFLPAIVPKLYRYQYDPQVKIQNSMKGIWARISRNRKGLIDEYGEAILDELIKTLTNPQWRVRESSCLALSDFLSGHATPKISQRFAELWETLFRVCDDQKESVREAANKAINTLRKVTLRYSSSERKEDAKQLLSIVLPVILDKGLRSRVQDVRLVSLATITKLTREAGIALRPQLDILIPIMLESLSELEPKLINYLAVRASEDQLESLDSARVAAARTSPTMEAIRNCVMIMRAEEVIALAPSLANLLRSSSAGLATRTAAAALVTTLATQAQRELMEAKVSDKLVKALEQGLTDRNSTIRKQFGTCLGYLAKFASSKTVETVIDNLKRQYLVADGELPPVSTRMAIAQVFRSLAIQSPELLKEYARDLAPLALMAMESQPINASLLTTADQEKETELKELWRDEIWIELVPGTDSAVRLYLTEMIQFCTELLSDNPLWVLKANSANLLKKVAETMNKSIDPQKTVEIMSLLIDSLHGRTWDGKQMILHALTALFKSCCQQTAGSDRNFPCTSMTSDLLEKLDGALLKECGKKSVPYRCEALLCSGFGCAYVGRPKWTELFDIVQPYLNKDEKLFDSDEDNDDDIPSSTKDNQRNQFRQSAIKMLSTPFTADHVLMKDNVTDENLTNLFKLILSSLPGSYWKVQLEVLDDLRSVLQQRWKLSGDDGDMPESAFSVLCDLLKFVAQLGGEASQTSLQEVCRIISVQLMEILQVRQNRSSKPIEGNREDFRSPLHELQRSFSSDYALKELIDKFLLQ